MSTATAGRPTVVTPSSRTVARRGAFWVAAAAAVLLITAVIAGSFGSATAAPALDPGSAAPDGARALVEVLRDGGVDVAASSTFGEALDSAAAGSSVLLFDPEGYLSPEQLRSLAETAGPTILVAPNRDALDAFLPSLAFAGVPATEEDVTATCDYPPAVRAAGIPPGTTSYRVIAPAEATGCFPTGEDAYALVRGADGTVVLGDPATLSNGGITAGGRAALALGMLSERESLAWYLPTAADVVGAAPSTAELTPPWLTPAILLIAAAAVAAAVWRGRRFGPLIAESLPVVVHASETAEGRARLYARGSARLRALDALRIGSTTRLSALLGLPAAAGLEDVARAAAGLLGRDPAPIFAVLVGDIPTTDAELVRLSDELLRLERAVTAAVADPGGSRPAAPGHSAATAPTRGNSTR